MESPDRKTDGDGEGLGDSDNDDYEAKLPFSPSPVLEQRSARLESEQLEPDGPGAAVSAATADESA